MSCEDYGLVKLGHAKLSRSITTALAVSVRAIKLRESFEAVTPAAGSRRISLKLWATLLLTDNRVGVTSKSPPRKVGGRLDVTFPVEVCQVAETQTTYLNQMPLKVLESFVL